jgi:hypothetical protein
MFYVVDTLAWRSLIRAMALVNDVFDGPQRNAIFVQVLQLEVVVVKQDLEPIQASWTKYGRSIMIDGWNDMKQQNIINILVSSCRGTIFLKSIIHM